MHVIFGIKYLFVNDESEEKIVFNFIKKNNYEIFNKLFIVYNNMDKEEPKFSGLDNVIYNIIVIISHFLKLADEKGALFLVSNTHFLNFFVYVFEDLYFKETKNLFLNLIVQLSHHTANVVINMVQNREDVLTIIKNNLNDNHFDIKMKFVDIVYSMLSLQSLDISIELYKNEIIEHLIKDNLPFEEEKTCLKYVLSSLLFFINVIKPIENNEKIEIINTLIKYGISNGFENSPNRFNDEHILIINQIKSEINNILNNNESKVIENGEKNVNINSSNNPFLIFNKQIEEKNDID